MKRSFKQHKTGMNNNEMARAGNKNGTTTGGEKVPSPKVALPKSPLAIITHYTLGDDG